MWCCVVGTIGGGSMRRSRALDMMVRSSSRRLAGPASASFPVGARRFLAFDWWKLCSQTLICILVFMYGPCNIVLVLGQCRVFSIRSRLLLLKGLGAALVSFVIDLRVTRVSNKATRGVDGRRETLAFLSSRFLMTFFMGFKASLASFAGRINFLSMSLTSSIMSALSSAKASSS